MLDELPLPQLDSLAASLPAWISQSMDLGSPLAGAAALQRHQRLLLFAELVGRDPADITTAELLEMEAEFAENKQVLAIAEMNAIRFAGELGVLADRILQVLAGQALASRLYAYHPSQYPSLGEALKDQLAELNENHPHGSEFGDLNWIVNTFIPLCQQIGVNGYEALWRPGTKAKTRALADYLRARLNLAGVTPAAVAAAEAADLPLILPAQLELEITERLTDAIDPQVSLRAYKVKHSGAHPPARPKLHAYHFIFGRGGATLIFYPGEADRIHLEQVVSAEFHTGTQAEIDRVISGHFAALRPVDPAAARKLVHTVRKNHRPAAAGLKASGPRARKVVS